MILSFVFICFLKSHIQGMPIHAPIETSVNNNFKFLHPASRTPLGSISYETLGPTPAKSSDNVDFVTSVFTIVFIVLAIPYIFLFFYCLCKYCRD